MRIEQAITGWLIKIQKELILNYDKLGLRASGDWEKSLEPFTEKKEGKVKDIDSGVYKIGIIGNTYTGGLEFGRRANKNQKDEKIHAWVGWAGSTFLKKWVKDKGINLNPYAVAYKIARYGWKVPNPFNKGGLVSDVLTENNFDDLLSSIGNTYIANFKSLLVNLIEEKYL